jgi:hypothetical protein
MAFISHRYSLPLLRRNKPAAISRKGVVGRMGSIVPIALSATKKNPATRWSLLLNQIDRLYPANIPYPVGLSLPNIKMIGFGITGVEVVYASRR